MEFPLSNSLKAGEIDRYLFNRNTVEDENIKAECNGCYRNEVSECSIANAPIS